MVTACGEDLKPQVATLEAKNTALKGQVQMLKGEKAALESIVGPPPAFLDLLYPPQSLSSSSR